MPTGTILERYLDERRAAGRIASTLLPAPGQYLLAHDPASNDPLAVPLFPAGLATDGFLVAPPLPRAWTPGLTLSLRGPLGHGFHLPASACRVVLAALDGSPAVLLSLLAPALAQEASVVLVCDTPPNDLPDDVEIQPLKSLTEVCGWADYLAVSVGRANWPEWKSTLARVKQAGGPREAEGLILTSMPCGGIGDCGVCSLSVGSDSKLICKDGPVFDLFELLQG
jgi:NAD(P)H-flavin reductase